MAQAIQYYKIRVVQKLTETYITLSLSEIAEALGKNGEDLASLEDTRGLINAMVEFSFPV